MDVATICRRETTIPEYDRAPDLHDPSRPDPDRRPPGTLRASTADYRSPCASGRRPTMSTRVVSPLSPVSFRARGPPYPGGSPTMSPWLGTSLSIWERP